MRSPVSCRGRPRCRPNGRATGVEARVIAEWLRTFQDAQLDALVDEALRHNLDLIAAAARVDGAAALATAARALLYPQLVATGVSGLAWRDDLRRPSGLALEVSWELDLWGRVRAAGASADAMREATAADGLSARQSVAALVATLWYQTIETDRLRATAVAAISVYEDLLRLVRARNDVGQVGAQDVALAGADLDRARERERSFTASLQQITRSLEILLGRYPAAEVQLAPDLPPVPRRFPPGCRPSCSSGARIWSPPNVEWRRPFTWCSRPRRPGYRDSR
jgi:outer membrane protein TolC